MKPAADRGAVNSPFHILIASLAGTAIEYFDFYIYATAAVLVFPQLFFPGADPAAGVLESLATFALAFFARPVGAALFGHFGDRIGRKATLVAALTTMGASTVAIGLLPPHSAIGVAAPLLLCLFRLGQGIGLGGEWGGAVLLAIENAPPGKRAWYGMFPQLGAPIGFLSSAGLFLLMSATLTEAQFFLWGWRIPFVASCGLVAIGLWARLTLTETPEFLAALKQHTPPKMPLAAVVTEHGGALMLGTLAAVSTFLLFYLMTVFTLSWGTRELGYSRNLFLILQMVAVLCFAIGIPISARLADRIGALNVMIGVSAAMFVFGLLFEPLFVAGHPAVVTAFMACGLLLMGLIYGPLGTALAALYPTQVRYTSTSVAFNAAGILGASLAPTVAMWLAGNWGIQAVGWYLCAATLLTLAALLAIRRRSRS
ncbi:MAG: MFS transporter [Nevskiaceae bacterium]|nr:MAG: MFS transporter [Nevskiaceae bacterium]TBR74478.1 MAG: MFS transporter [Nevskiaceae bacterium]